MAGSSGGWHTRRTVLRDHTEAAGGPKGSNLPGGVGESSPGSHPCTWMVPSPQRTDRIEAPWSRLGVATHIVKALGIVDKAILIADAGARVTTVAKPGGGTVNQSLTATARLSYSDGWTPGVTN